jgi:hypothetical protein
MDSEKCFSQFYYVTVQQKISTYIPLEYNQKCGECLDMLFSSTLNYTGTNGSAIMFGI